MSTILSIFPGKKRTTSRLEMKPGPRLTTGSARSVMIGKIGTPTQHIRQHLHIHIHRRNLLRQATTIPPALPGVQQLIQLPRRPSTTTQAAVTTTIITVLPVTLPVLPITLPVTRLPPRLRHRLRPRLPHQALPALDENDELQSKALLTTPLAETGEALRSTLATLQLLSKSLVAALPSDS